MVQFFHTAQQLIPQIPLPQSFFFVILTKSLILLYYFIEKS